ncbi:unnamed protein product [Psylliodes chrysocephalus]|uniref:CCHC-type domain-containing protein n=1 Tax=Psylliodes chrysocephalus TaxID=3402493 RepID=A0A9P0G9D9_9CUCU|nr:unnamed protein product [Psylliodes chrysocephala]
MANNQMAATVTIPTVGLVRCRLEKRLRVPRCARCWFYEHRTDKCQATERKESCFRCGKDGHIAKECDNEEACPVCNETGHKHNRRHSLGRSPPRDTVVRRDSFIEMEGDINSILIESDKEESDERKSKRKRVESPYANEERKVLREALKKVEMISESLGKLATENTNTKKEIKEKIKKLSRAVQKLSVVTEDFIEIKGQERINPPEEKVTKIITTNRCSRCESEEITKEEVETVVEEGKWERIDEICNERWETNAYLTTRIGKGNPTNIGGENLDIALLFDPEKGPDCINLAGQRHIKDVIDLGKIKKGMVATLENTRRLEIDGETLTKKTGRANFLAGLAPSDEGNFKLLMEIRNRMEQTESEKLVMVSDPPGGHNGEVPENSGMCLLGEK